MPSSSAQHIAHFLKSKNPSELISIIAYDDDSRLFYMDDNYLGAAYLCQPLTGVSTDILYMLDSIYSIPFPDESFVQFSLFASQDILPYIQAFNRLRDTSKANIQNKELLEEVVRKQRDWMRQGAFAPLDTRTDMQLRDFQVLVTFKIPVKSAEISEEEIHTAGEIARDLNTTLNALHMSPLQLNDAALIHFYKTLLNWGDNASWRTGFDAGTHERTEIRKQIFDLDTSIETHSDHLKLGNKYARLMSVRNWSEFIHLGYMNKLIGDTINGAFGVRTNFYYNLNIYYPPADLTRIRLENRRMLTNHQAFGRLLKHAPRIGFQKKSHDIMYDSMQKGYRPIQAYLQFVLFADDKESLDRITANARTVYRGANFDIQVDPYFVLPLFLNALPLNSQKEAVMRLDRYHTMTTQHIIHLMPIIADWKGKGPPVMNFVSRQGQPMSYDIFAGNNNYNLLMAATSGSGKSTAANELILNYLSNNAHAWVIDNGGSYKKLCDMLGGDYIDFDPNHPVNLNPFPLIKNLKESEDLLVNQLIAMASWRDPITDFQDAVLREVIHDLWAKYQQGTTVTHVHEVCKTHSEKQVRHFGQQLYPFTIKGNNGAYFHGDKPVDYMGGLTVLELGRLSGSKHLQQVVLLQLISQVTHHIGSLDRGIRKILLIDECWSLFRMSDVSAFLETSWRTIRKFGGSAIAITQSINDAYNSPSGKAMVENSEHIWLLGQKEATVEDMKASKRIPLSDYEYDLLKSVHTIPGQYSEIFIYADGVSGVARLYLDRYRQLLYTTLPAEVSALTQLTQSGLSIKEAINQLIAIENGARAT